MRSRRRASHTKAGHNSPPKTMKLNYKLRGIVINPTHPSRRLVTRAVYWGSFSLSVGDLLLATDVSDTHVHPVPPRASGTLFFTFSDLTLEQVCAAHFPFPDSEATKTEITNFDKLPSSSPRHPIDCKGRTLVSPDDRWGPSGGV